MAAPLYPSFPIDQPVSRRAPDPAALWRRAPLFDWQTGDYARDASGAIVLADGWTAWRQWCEKALLTQQRAYVIYRRGHGVDHERNLRLRPRALVEAEYTRTITAALKRHPATRAVRAFSYVWAGHALYPALTADPVAGAPARLDYRALVDAGALTGGI